MKYLSECIEDAKDSARIERKFIMTKGQCIIAESLLKSIGFKRLYENRIVSSVLLKGLFFLSIFNNVFRMA